MDLNGSVAVVTGGASGIGAAITKRLRDEGATLKTDWVTGDVITADGGASLVTARVDRKP